jgi:hypothetical protein
VYLSLVLCLRVHSLSQPLQVYLSLVLCLRVHSLSQPLQVYLLLVRVLSPPQVYLSLVRVLSPQAASLLQLFLVLCLRQKENRMHD